MLRNGEPVTYDGKEGIVIGPFHTTPQPGLSHNEYGNAALSYEVIFGEVSEIISESKLIKKTS